ncbi:hypothetical protein N0V88_002493 [Collariella sp. IMI 366227]|nr:hypothetical protein N0V88_002493 [Collariella sp. IMI 366227]
MSYPNPDTDSAAPDGGPLPDRGPAVFAVTTATLALATLFVAARMVSRAAIVRRTGWDDYVMVLAWLIAVFLSLSIDLGVKRGLGRHDKDIPPEKSAGLRMSEYVFSILYNPALMATKTSILIFYLKLSKNTEKILRLASWAVLGIVNVAGTILTFMNIFQCKPIAAAWDINFEAMQCIPLLTEFICSAPVNVTTDLAILALPIPVLTSMRLPPRQKTILVMTFALGIFVTVVDVVRIYYLQQAIDHVPTSVSSDPMAIYGEGSDFSWNASLALMWSAVEVNVGIICACIPTLKPLIIRILPAMLLDPNASWRSTTRTSTKTDGSASTKDNRRGSVSSMLSCGATPNILFFLWGFSYGLLHTLNDAVARTLGLTSIYFGAGYLLGPLLVGEWLLRHDEHHRVGGRRRKWTGSGVGMGVRGFKATFVVGLLIYGVGTIMFWPGAVLAAYGGFMVSSFVVGFGLAVLETAANPFMVLCGPPEYAEFRLLLAQGVQAVGSVLSGLLADRVFFPRIAGAATVKEDSTTLIDVQWTYLAVTLLSVLLAFFFYYMPLPEVSDSELAALASRLPVDPRRTVLTLSPTRRISLRTATIAAAVVSQWCYVSAQENISLFFNPLLTTFTINGGDLLLTPEDSLLLAHALFALSRFLTALICYLRPHLSPSFPKTSHYLPTP